MAAAIRFNNIDKTDFYRVLTQRVESYFKEKKLSKYADGRMVLKTVCMLSLYCLPFLLILTGMLPMWAMWLCCVIMGVGIAGIGMSVMHDANHGAYSKNKTLNKWMGYSLNLIGGDAENWKVQHNQLHHTYTNIHGHDLDIREMMRMRFTPAVKHRNIQRIQVFYVFFFYSLQTFFWVAVKDFIQFFKFSISGIKEETQREKTIHFLRIILTKVLYIAYIFVLPMLLLHLTFGQWLIGFLTMHAVGGLTLTTIFQMAHVVEGVDYPMPDDKGNLQSEWAIHQMNTTADFAPKNKLLTFFAGGLNFQIEHHLFQRVCHIHYPAIAPIVQQTAKEYGIPYLCNNTFFDALVSHVRHLKKLGWNEALSMASDI